MKDFKEVNQNDLLLEFLNYVNENLLLDITKVEVTKYNEQKAIYCESKSIFVKLDNVEYYVNLFYDISEKQITLTINELVNDIWFRVDEIVSNVK